MYSLPFFADTTYDLIYHKGKESMERDNLMHGARTALNTDAEIRAWAEDFLKKRTRSEKSEMTDEEFDKYWRYHKPEIVHAGAADAIQAYKSRER
jgi:hypothetical protein